MTSRELSVCACRLDDMAHGAQHDSRLRTRSREVTLLDALDSQDLLDSAPAHTEHFLQLLHRCPGFSELSTVPVPSPQQFVAFDLNGAETDDKVRGLSQQRGFPLGSLDHGHAPSVQLDS